MPLSVPGAPLLSGLSRCFQLFLGETPDEGHRKFSASCFCSALVENPESFKKQVGVTAERSIITSFFMMSVIWFYNIELFNILHNWIFKNMKCYDFLDILNCTFSAILIAVFKRELSSTPAGGAIIACAIP